MIKEKILYYDSIMMSKYLFLLGREPDLSLAELSSLFSSVKKQGNFASVEAEGDILPLIASLGGTIKAGKIWAENISK